MLKLVISDLHLSDRFDKREFDYLKELFSKYDEIIINGDFWDYYQTSFDKFVNSGWKKLFPILKEKTIYLYGNHDKKEWSDERVQLFSKEQKQSHKFKTGETTFIIQHGHKLFGEKNWDLYLDIRLVRILRIAKLTPLVDKMFSYIDKNMYKKAEKYAKKLNKDEFLITGHKHIPKIDEEKKYAVTGSLLSRKSSYIEINDKGDVKLINEKY